MNVEATFARAEALQAAGKHGKAAAIYKYLIKMSEDPRFYIAYGVCLQGLGHWRDSANNLKRGIDLKPNYCEGDARLFLAESLLKLGQKKKLSNNGSWSRAWSRNTQVTKLCRMRQRKCLMSTIPVK